MLLNVITAPCVLTPHDGEYKRLFAQEGRPADARAGGRGAERRGDAAQGGATPWSQRPTGARWIQPEAPPCAGHGRLGATCSPASCSASWFRACLPLEAAAAAVWLHARAGFLVGTGLIAEDLPEALPGALVELEQLQQVWSRQAPKLAHNRKAGRAEGFAGRPASVAAARCSLSRASARSSASGTGASCTALAAGA